MSTRQTGSLPGQQRYQTTVKSMGHWAAIATAALLLTAPLALSQQTSGSSASSAAQSDPQAQLQLGQAYYYGFGGVDRDPQQGLQLMQQAADAGHVPAQSALGAILLFDVDANRQKKGVQLLEMASKSGDVEAQKTLAGALLWGVNIDRDTGRSQSLYEQSAAGGNTAAQRELGRQLVLGSAFYRDAPRGVSLLEQAGAAGDSAALVALGTFLYDGTAVGRDRKRALGLFQQAAAAGDGAGLEWLGARMMWAEQSPQMAERYLQQAGELGRGSAWSTLASGAMWGYLPGRSRAKFDGYAELARAAGQTDVAVMEAQRRIWGISMRASGPEAIKILELAADTGNRDALWFLIGQVRNGNKWNIRKQPDRARAYLDRYDSFLSPTERAHLELSIDAAEVATIPKFRTLARRYEVQPELKTFQFSQDMFAANPNFVVYMLQDELRAAGRYTGPIDGLATEKTLRALRAACQGLRDTSLCGNTVLHPNRVAALMSR